MTNCDQNGPFLDILVYVIAHFGQNIVCNRFAIYCAIYCAIAIYFFDSCNSNMQQQYIFWPKFGTLPLTLPSQELALFTISFPRITIFVQARRNPRNRNLSACQTCSSIPETPEGITKKCKTLKSGLKQCMYRCVNKERFHFPTWVVANQNAGLSSPGNSLLATRF